MSVVFWFSFCDSTSVVSYLLVRLGFGAAESEDSDNVIPIDFYKSSDDHDNEEHAT